MKQACLGGLLLAAMWSASAALGQSVQPPVASPDAASQPVSPPATAPATAQPGAQALEPPVQELQFWRQRMRDAIQQHMTPPPSIPLDAQVELEVSLMPSGLAADIATRRASGYPDLDAALRGAVLVATPLPLPADAQSYARLRRFSVLYEVRSGVRVVDAHSVETEAARAEAFGCRAQGVPAAPSCSTSGSRVDLLTCYAQAVRARTVATAAACGAAVYPTDARRNKWEGTVQVGVNFENGGRLGAVAVAQSSGHPLLDQRAVDLVRESIVPPPPELFATAFVVQVPVVFQMHAKNPAAAAPAAKTEAAPAKATAKPKSATKKKPAKKKKKKSTSRKQRV